MKMAKEKKADKLEGFYKGYDMKWLKAEPQHPDFKLVEEFEKKNK